MKDTVSAWKDMMKAEFPLSNIKKGSQEFEIMKKAAENGVASTQHSQETWYQEVANDPKTTKIWYHKAKGNEHPVAEQAIKELKMELTIEKTIDLLLHTKKQLQYKNRSLVKDGNTIWYGNKNDQYIIAIDILRYLNGKPELLLMQLVDNKTQTKSLKQNIFNDLQKALYIGTCWLEAALDNYTREQEQEKQNNSNNRGEKDVEYHIKWIVRALDKYIVSIDNDCESKYRRNCILLKNSAFIDETQEYDHILVTPSGVVLIETKGWKGRIDVTSDGKWIRYNEEGGTPYGIANPIAQMRRHEELMKSIIPDVPVYSILCFSNPSAIVNGKENIKEYTVIYIEQLENTLSSLCSKNKYSNEKIDNIAATVESYKANKMQ